MVKAKRRYKKEATQVSLGEREEVSRELVQAQIRGYKNDIIEQRNGFLSSNEKNLCGPRVREPSGGLFKRRKLDREFYRKRQAAGGGICSGSIQFHERNWNLVVRSLFFYTSF